MRPRMELETLALCDDNSGASHLARSEDIDIHHHRTRDIVKNAEIKIVHVERSCKTADFLTKLSMATY